MTRGVTPEELARQLVKTWAGCDDDGLRANTPGSYGALAVMIAAERRRLIEALEAARRVIEQVRREVASDPDNRWCRNALVLIESLTPDPEVPRG